MRNNDWLQGLAGVELHFVFLRERARCCGAADAALLPTAHQLPTR